MSLFMSLNDIVVSYCLCCYVSLYLVFKNIVDILFMLLLYVLSTLYYTFVIFCYKALPCIVGIVAISLNLVDKYCWGCNHVIVGNNVILNCVYCLHCFCAKILFLY